ncbi:MULTISPECIES: DUF6614 family protein [unclassified Roseobacter]|uniref:DUF6614 family protein n=1 Tax=unclassified Roseobacter TaxID=196798 RepID=UPI0018A2A62E|nr:MULTISPECIES: DUF6614 family protein [unclassified Roseobacter]MDW3184162.1 DUF6614 family protein [Roseobacter sp.]
MNVYCCMITLKDDAKALLFAKALDDWMGHLKSSGAIGDWRLMRRKLNLAADCYRDFLLEIEVDGLSQLDDAFRLTGTHDDDVGQMHRAVNDLIATAEFALYRPYPDMERAERMALL